MPYYYQQQYSYIFADCLIVQIAHNKKKEKTLQPCHQNNKTLYSSIGLNVFVQKHKNAFHFYFCEFYASNFFLYLITECSIIYLLFTITTTKKLLAPKNLTYEEDSILSES